MSAIHLKRSAFLLMLATGTLFNIAVAIMLMVLATSGNPLWSLVAGEGIPVLASLFAIRGFGPWVLQRTAAAHWRAILTGMGCVIAAIVIFGLVAFVLVRGERAWDKGLLPSEAGFYDFIFEGRPISRLIFALTGPLALGSIASFGLPEILGALVGHWVWTRAAQTHAGQIGSRSGDDQPIV
jgi:hypothetical protein